MCWCCMTELCSLSYYSELKILEMSRALMIPLQRPKLQRCSPAVVSHTFSLRLTRCSQLLAERFTLLAPLPLLLLPQTPLCTVQRILNVLLDVLQNLQTFIEKYSYIFYVLVVKLKPGVRIILCPCFFK